jgi:hypothetical protein
MRIARDVFEAVVHAAYVGGPEQDRWLRDIFTSLRHIELSQVLGLRVAPLTKTARRLLVLNAIARRDDFDEARLLLREADEAFERIPDEALRARFGKVTDSPGGAGKFGAHRVAAELTLMAGALSTRKRVGESDEHALKRVAGAFQTVQARLERSRQRKP